MAAKNKIIILVALIVVLLGLNSQAQSLINKIRASERLMRRT
jgi:hypothetical protein